MFHLLRLWWKIDAVTVSYHGTRGFEEEKGQLRRLSVMFGSMGSIIAAYTDDLSGCDRRQQLDRIDGQPDLSAAKLAVGRSVHQADLALR
jgi:hypothetical protein